MCGILCMFLAPCSFPQNRLFIPDKPVETHEYREVHKQEIKGYIQRFDLNIAAGKDPAYHGK